MQKPSLGELAEMLKELGAAEEAVGEIAPLVQMAMPAIAKIGKVAIGNIAVPVVTELNEMLKDPQGQALVHQLGMLVLNTKASAARVSLSEEGAAAQGVIAEFRAKKAKAQFDAFASVGFTQKQAMDLLLQTQIADAIREAPKSWPSAVQSASSKSKSGD